MSGENLVSFDSYEQMAEYYFNYVDRKPFNAFYERPGTLALLPGVSGKKVLDAACAAVIGLDFSPRMIEMTRRRVGNRAAMIRADLNEPLPFITDGSVDLVLSSLTLHYLEDWSTVMGEFYRILRPDGVMVLSVHHPFMDFTYFQRENYFLTELLDDEWDTPQGKVKVQFYRRPLSKITDEVLAAGFAIEKLAEPMPTEEFRQAQPEVYQKLTKRPQFLFLRARKR